MRWLWAADGWLIECIYQPIVNRAADRGVTKFHLAQWCLSLCLIPAAIIDFWDFWIEGQPFIAGGAKELALVINVIVTLSYVSVYGCLVKRDAEKQENVWLTPVARLIHFPVRLFWLLMLAFGVVQIVLRSSIINQYMIGFVGDGLFVSALFFWACRIRPPARRHPVGAGAPGMQKESS